MDGDPLCDFDQVAGQCTFHVAPCFSVRDLNLNAGDPALPVCAPPAVTEFQLLKPSARQAAKNPSDALIRARFQVALAELSLSTSGANVCTSRVNVPVPLVIRRGSPRPGNRVLRSRTISIDGIGDTDKLKLTCLPRP
jgi:hypothetical protein